MTDDEPSEWVTIKVPKADREQAKDYRPDDATYGDCLVAGAERLNDSLDSDPAIDLAGDGRVLPEDVVDELVEEFAVAVEPKTGMVDDSKIAREVARQIDYVELAGKVADELEGRMR